MHTPTRRSRRDRFQDAWAMLAGVVMAVPVLLASAVWAAATLAAADELGFDPVEEL